MKSLTSITVVDTSFTGDIGKYCRAGTGTVTFSASTGASADSVGGTKLAELSVASPVVVTGWLEVDTIVDLRLLSALLLLPAALDKLALNIYWQSTCI